jgi:hypothetical protein
MVLAMMKTPLHVFLHCKPFLEGQSNLQNGKSFFDSVIVMGIASFRQ